MPRICRGRIDGTLSRDVPVLALYRAHTKTITTVLPPDGPASLTSKRVLRPLPFQAFGIRSLGEAVVEHAQCSQLPARQSVQPMMAQR